MYRRLIAMTAVSVATFAGLTEHVESLTEHRGTPAE